MCKNDDYIRLPGLGGEGPDDRPRRKGKHPAKYEGFGFNHRLAAIRSRPLAYEVVGTWRLSNDLLVRRSQQRMLQSELAAASGISQTALSNIELGKSVPSVGTALVLATILQTKVDKLFWLSRRYEQHL